MERISKTEMDFMIEHNIIRQNKGNYGDALVVTNKQGGKNKKQRYVNPNVYSNFVRLKSQETFDINKVKDNQRYMFS